jgi:3-methyladenine DNA glycosylase AlkC
MTAVSSYLGPPGIARLAEELRSVISNFPMKRFTRLANSGLETLSLFGRANHVAKALDSALQRPFPKVVRIIVEAAGSPRSESGYGPMENFRLLAYTRLISLTGGPYFAESMWGLRELTRRFTSEFDIRPFLINAESETLQILRGWLEDEDFHVRRLVSEGTRTRLPWGVHLRSLRHDPRKVTELIERLRTDSSRYVQISVANNLADMIKDNQDYGLSLAEKWVETAHPVTRKIVHHAVRFPAKKGNARAIALRLPDGRNAESGALHSV